MCVDHMHVLPTVCAITAVVLYCSDENCGTAMPLAPAYAQMISVQLPAACAREGSYFKQVMSFHRTTILNPWLGRKGPESHLIVGR